MRIEITEVTRENWDDALRLAVAPAQQEFVPSVMESVAEAYIRPHEKEIVTPYAIYADGQMVGFFAYSSEPESADNYWINGFLIDRRFQGRGYGKAAFGAILEHVRATFPQCRRVGLTVCPDNQLARRLYEGFGFRNTEELYQGELVHYLDFA
ncbi:MAG TPA: GNAT family N-acetyltransferase [Acidobacteriota bacterium]|nr:GNAT family N-acetyltransferase [Acidobacteriota bacterium]